MGKKYQLGALAVLVFVIVGIVLIESRRDKPFVPEDPKSSKNSDKQLKAGKSKVHQPEWLDDEREALNGNNAYVSAKQVEAKFDKDNPNARFDVYAQKGYGKFKALKASDEKNNPYFQSVLEALNNKAQFPERLSAAIRPKPFDQSAWLSDPEYRQKYVYTHEPGRCYESLEAGKDVPRIKRISSYMQMAAQSDVVNISVQTAPSEYGMPVTATSFDAGQFLPSKLTSQTVVNDPKSGIATFRFKAGDGTIEDVNILIASPMMAGSLKYKLNIRLDDDPELFNN